MRKYLKIIIVAAVALAVFFSLAASRSSKEAWLGVTGQTVDDDLAEVFDLDSEYGVIVNDVFDDSPAEKAGLEEDDIIIAIAGARVRDYDDLIDIIEDHEPGDKVSLKVMRDDKEIELEAQLDNRPREYRGDRYWYSPDPPRIPKVPKIPRIPNIDRHYVIHMYDRAYIGVRLTELTDQLGDYFGVEKGRGVLITEVEQDSPAEKAGLKAGDVIVAVDGDKVFEYEDVTDAVHDKKEGETLSVTVIRDKKEVALDVEVAEREDVDDDNHFYWSTPDVDYYIPHAKGFRYGIVGDDFFESEEFNEEMKELQEELMEMQEELKDIRIEFRDDDLRKELKELEKELKEIEKRLD